MAEDFPSLEAEKNPGDGKGEFGGSCKSCGSLQILSLYFVLPRKTKACSQKILPFRSFADPRIF